MSKVTKEMALDYHREGKPGKIEVVPTVPFLPNRISRSPIHRVSHILALKSNNAPRMPTSTPTRAIL